MKFIECTTRTTKRKVLINLDLVTEVYDHVDYRKIIFGGGESTEIVEEYIEIKNKLWVS